MGVDTIVATRDNILARLGEMIAEGESIIEAIVTETEESVDEWGQFEQHTQDRIDRERFVRWRTNAATVLELAVPRDHVHRKYVAGMSNLDINRNSLVAALNILRAVKEDYERGLLGSADGGTIPTRADTCEADADASGARPSVHSAGKRFAVALSFPGEYRQFVGKVAEGLAKPYGKERVLYDEYLEGELARTNLDVYLQNLYHKDSELIVVFLCAEYEQKDWCGLEWRAVRDLIKQRYDHIMLMRFDDAQVAGVLSIDGYIDLRGRTPDETVRLIVERAGVTANADRDISDPAVIRRIMAILATSCHSFQWFRDNTDFDCEDQVFMKLVTRHPDSLEEVRIIQPNDTRLPGMRLTEAGKKTTAGDMELVDPAPLNDDRRTATEARLLDALNEAVSFDFIAVPIDDVIAFLAAFKAINIVLDGGACGTVLPDVTLQLENVTLKSALQHICRQAGLTWSVEDEAILLSLKT